MTPAERRTMKIVAGNWKMYKTVDEAQTYVREVAAYGTPPQDKVQAILFPDRKSVV